MTIWAYRSIDRITNHSILYDVPSRTACNLADETVVRFAEMPQLIGLKNATGDVTRPARLGSLVEPRFSALVG
jgi:4-hydroxy-tetrahydrodipicolinate synthase